MEFDIETVSGRRINYTRWKHKVDHHIRMLIGDSIDNFLFREYYDNDFTPKVVAFLAVKNCYILSDDFNNIDVWKREFFKYLSLFLDDTVLEMDPNMDHKKILHLFHQGLHPFLVAEGILQQKGLLPQPKFEYGISPPKF